MNHQITIDLTLAPVLVVTLWYCMPPASVAHCVACCRMFKQSAQSDVQKELNRHSEASTPAPARGTPLGSWDQTFARSDSLVPRVFDSHTCGCLFKSACDQNYYLDLVRSNFTLCPAGDDMWSMRFLEAILAGSIPVLSEALHAGHNPQQRAIPYHYLLASDFEPRAGRSTPVYCPEWAARNLELFLTHQWPGADARSLRPSMAGCPQEADALHACVA